ncbi:hypothetical protein GWK47_034498 [Chionoecetes opilio]|uniref:Uncharacterized protein n=1 Tax=Chionoecetes opilio TaxID=41210 RepID=A0A8J4YG49_CHIOP|nr:hypothetical protein GWK47_034498 [Chionoecetes opilio]
MRNDSDAPPPPPPPREFWRRPPDGTLSYATTDSQRPRYPCVAAHHDPLRLRGGEGRNTVPPGTTHTAPSNLRKTVVASPSSPLTAPSTQETPNLNQQVFHVARVTRPKKNLQTSKPRRYKNQKASRGAGCTIGIFTHTAKYQDTPVSTILPFWSNISPILLVSALAPLLPALYFFGVVEDDAYHGTPPPPSSPLQQHDDVTPRPVYCLSRGVSGISRLTKRRHVSTN